MIRKPWLHRSPWRPIGLVGSLGAALVCAGCLFAPQRVGEMPAAEEAE
jgi:hypothetical protein